MADGNILIVGGDNQSIADAAGQTILINGRQGRRVYQSCPEGPAGDACRVGTWIQQPDMNNERWYPTVTTLADGSAIIVSGSRWALSFEDKDLNYSNPTYEYWPMKNTTGAPWPRKLEVLEWAWPWNLYPMVFQLPDNNVLMFVANRTVILNPTDDTVTENIPQILLPDKAPWIYPNTPTSFMLPLTAENNYRAELMICGGTHVNLEADKRCIHLNMGEEKPQWREADPMPSPHVMPDTALLPDGTVLLTNGAKWGIAGGDAGISWNAQSPNFDAHIYDPRLPEGKRWRSIAPATVPRLYHSGVILLPDARVVTTGSEEQNYVDVEQNRTDCMPWTKTACTNPFEYRIEALTPPYLYYDVERPVIAPNGCPAAMSYGSSFLVSTQTDATKIDFVSFIRYSTSTHSTNMDQRLVELKNNGANATHLLLQAPENGGLAPPGNWMLFLVRDGKPSVACTILLNAQSPRLADAAPVNAQAPPARSAPKQFSTGANGTGPGLNGGNGGNGRSDASSLKMGGVGIFAAAVGAALLALVV
ncbi:hypothetical protein HK102_011774 [Quaeritorhiza haematococci]|nr:hypothetical protein HK102_011774 [Quaeritorhiza haematococci]